MKILKLNLFQETTCYKKPFSFKVSETYPLPPYSTVIGMLHKIIGANPGEYYDMDISIQGNYESIFTNYQSLKNYKKDGKITTMPRDVHLLHNVELVIHVKAEDEIIDRIYENIIHGKETFTLGRNEDLVRVDSVKIINEPKIVRQKFINKYNAYVPLKYTDKYENGINYKLNSKYTIENEIRIWEKVDVIYIERHTDESIMELEQDEDEDYIYWYKG